MLARPEKDKNNNNTNTTIEHNKQFNRNRTHIHAVSGVVGEIHIGSILSAIDEPRRSSRTEKNNTINDVMIITNTDTRQNFTQ